MPATKKKGGDIHARVPVEMIEALDKVAESENRSRSEIVCMAIDEFLKGRKDV